MQRASRYPLSAGARVRAGRTNGWARRRGAASAFVLGLSCLLPYPALSIGDSTGLQIGSLVALAFLMVFHSSLVTRNVRAWLLLCLPLVVSTFLGSFFGVHAPSLATGPLVTVAWGLFTLPLVVTGTFVLRHTLGLLVGVASGVLLHVVVGVYQVYSFRHLTLPLIWLYQNPSFGAFNDEYARTVALYIQRPFGLFPEPSAMATSIGPWLLLCFAHLLRLLPGTARLQTGWGTALYLSAALVGGMWLLFASESGAALLIAPALLVFFALFLLRRARSAAGAYFGLVGLGVFTAVVAAVAYASLQERVVANFAADSSWSLRFRSITGGFDLLLTRSPFAWLTGVGAGQSSSLMQDHLGLDAVWSVVFSYTIENGAFGTLVWFGLLLFVVGAVWRSRARTVGLTLLGFWLLCLTFVTSYFSLLSAWSFLGLLLNWDRLTETVGDGEADPS